MMTTNSNDEKFLMYILDETESNRLKWSEAPYGGYLYDCDWAELGMAAASGYPSSHYSNNILNKQYAHKDNIRVYYCEIEEVKIYILEKFDYNYTIPKHEYSMKILSYNFNSDSKSEQNFNYTVSLENKDREFVTLERITNYIKKHYIVNSEKNAQDFMKKITDKF